MRLFLLKATAALVDLLSGTCRYPASHLLFTVWEIRNGLFKGIRMYSRTGGTQSPRRIGTHSHP